MKEKTLVENQTATAKIQKDGIELPISIGIDVDNTLLEHSKYEPFKFGNPKENVEEFLKIQKEKGRLIRLYTARCDVEYSALLNHLKNVDLLKYIDHIQCGKMYNTVYICDRSLNFNDNWLDLRELIEHFLLNKENLNDK